MCKLYGYARVSTQTQRLDRQIHSIEEYVIDYVDNKKIERIYKEKYTGTKLDRPQFNSLLKNVKSGDTIIFDSVSRMSRTAEEGYRLYMELMNKGIELVFINEPHISTSYYKKMIGVKIDIATDKEAKSTKKTVKRLIQDILDAVTEFQNEETKEKIKIAFEQAQKEVDDLHTRIVAGIKATKANNENLPESERKQIGRVRGQKVETKKSKEMKVNIQKMSKDFDGNMTDVEILKILNISRNTYYKYKKELLLNLD